MAPGGGKGTSVSASHMSPGDAAFLRLREREAARVKRSSEEPDRPPPPPPKAAPAAEPGVVPPQEAAPEAHEPAPTPQAVARKAVPQPKREPSAEAAGSPHLKAAPPPPPQTQVSRPEPKRPAAPKGARPPSPGAAAAPAQTAKPQAPLKVLPPRPRPAARPTTTVDAGEDPNDLEAVLRNQLQSIAASLDPQPTPRRASDAAPPVTMRRAPPPAPPKGTGPSEFAPDPVRQRTYFDLKAPPAPRAAEHRPAKRAEPEERLQLPPIVDPTAGSRDDEVEPRRSRGRRMSAAFARMPEVGARSRGLDARTLSIAALVGVGVGFVGLTVMSQFVTPSETSTVVAGASLPVERIVANAAPVDAGAPPADEVRAREPAPIKEQSRLLPEAPSLRGGIAPEGRTEARVVDVVPVRPPEATVAEAPPVASEPVEANPPATRFAESNRTVPSPTFENDLGPTGQVFAYAPVQRRAPQAPAAESSPASNTGAGTAKVNVAVNMRSAPDNDASVVTVLASGTTVKIEKCDFWCEVVVNGKRGFIYRKFVGR